MADKEERIMIFDIGEQCSYRCPASVTYFAKNGDKLGTRQELVCHREDNWGANCDDKWCEKCDKKDLVGMPRAEAVERMAKAICANEDEYADCKQCEFNGPEDCKRYYRNNWLYTAEAALNALLEGK